MAGTSLAEKKVNFYERIAERQGNKLTEDQMERYQSALSGLPSTQSSSGSAYQPTKEEIAAGMSFARPQDLNFTAATPLDLARSSRYGMTLAPNISTPQGPATAYYDPSTKRYEISQVGQPVYQTFDYTKPKDTRPQTFREAFKTGRGEGSLKPYGEYLSGLGERLEERRKGVNIRKGGLTPVLSFGLGAGARASGFGSYVINKPLQAAGLAAGGSAALLAFPVAAGAVGAGYLGYGFAKETVRTGNPFYALGESAIDVGVGYVGYKGTKGLYKTLGISTQPLIKTGVKSGESISSVIGIKELSSEPTFRPGKVNAEEGRLIYGLADIETITPRRFQLNTRKGKELFGLDLPAKKQPSASLIKVEDFPSDIRTRVAALSRGGKGDKGFIAAGSGTATRPTGDISYTNVDLDVNVGRPGKLTSELFNVKGTSLGDITIGKAGESLSVQRTTAENILGQMTKGQGITIDQPKEFLGLPKPGKKEISLFKSPTSIESGQGFGIRQYVKNIGGKFPKTLKEFEFNIGGTKIRKMIDLSILTTREAISNIKSKSPTIGKDFGKLKVKFEDLPGRIIQRGTKIRDIPKILGQKDIAGGVESYFKARKREAGLELFTPRGRKGLRGTALFKDIYKGADVFYQRAIPETKPSRRGLILEQPKAIQQPKIAQGIIKATGLAVSTATAPKISFREIGFRRFRIPVQDYGGKFSLSINKQLQSQNKIQLQAQIPLQKQLQSQLTKQMQKPLQIFGRLQSNRQLQLQTPIVGQLQLQIPIQKQIPSLKTGQIQLTKLITPPITTTRVPEILIPKIPVIPLFEMPKIYDVAKQSQRYSRKNRYAPSLVGLISGIRKSRAPKGELTGFEIRYPVGNSFRKNLGKILNPRYKSRKRNKT